MPLLGFRHLHGNATYFENQDKAVVLAELSAKHKGAAVTAVSKATPVLMSVAPAAATVSNNANSNVIRGECLRPIELKKKKTVTEESTEMCRMANERDGGRRSPNDDNCAEQV